MRILITLILAVCLPLQSVGAVTMPFCEAGDMASMDMASAHHEMPMDHEMSMDHASHDMNHHGEGDAGSQQGLDCNQCGLCHLACASALPSSTPVLSDVLKSVYQTALAANVSSFQADPLRKPPRGDLR